MTEGNTITSRPAIHGKNDYAELKRQIKEAGLLEKQPGYYARKIGLLLAFFVLGILMLLFVKPFWLQLLNAVYLAFVTTQLGLLGHDAGHRQIFHSTWKNDVVGLITGNLLVGISNAWWLGRHNAHHSHPNQRHLDPDVSIPIIAFTADDLHEKPGYLRRRFLRYQAYFFFPVLSLASLDMQKDSIVFLFQGKGKYRFLECAMLAIHFICYFTVIFSRFTIWQAILFTLIHQVISGVFMGSIFAPNHKGMPVLDTDCQMDFLHRQVITARNVFAHPLTDFWYGGLNYQIEHHLFPSMPRNQLRKAQQVVKTFCQERAIPYYETNLLQSYRETLQSLHQVSALLRTTSKPSSM